MSKTKFNNGMAESVGAITVAVVGKQAANGDTESGVIIHGREEEGHRISRGEGGQDLSKSDAGMVVDGDMEILPTGVVFAAATAIRTDGHIGEASELFDIQMQKISWSGMFIADDGDRRLQIAYAIEAKTAKNTAHSSAAQTSGFGNIQTGKALPTKLFNKQDRVLTGSARTAVRTGGAVLQTSYPFVAISLGPLGNGA